MKRFPGNITRLGIVVVLLVIAACNVRQAAEFDKLSSKEYVEIHPPVIVKRESGASLTSELAQYDKKLYRIQTFSRGSGGDIIGELDEKYMRKGLIDEVEKEAIATEFTGSAIQIGLGSSTKKGWILRSGSSTRPTPTPHPDGSGRTPDTGSSTHPTPSVSPEATRDESTPTPTPSTGPVDEGSSTKPLAQQSDQLVEELKPILARYNEK